MVAVAGRRSRRRRWIVVLFVFVAAVVIAGYGAASFYVYDTIGSAKPCDAKFATNTPDAFTVPAGFDQSIAQANLMPKPQDITFTSRDPNMPLAKLAGWWIPAATADAPAVIVIHGVYSCRREANVLLPAGMLYRNGFSVFVMDMRDHGDSEGDDGRFAGGSEEYLDVLGAWDWLRAKGIPAEQIGIVGVSFGSINAIVAGGQETQVAAVWADSSTTRMDIAIGNFLADQLQTMIGVADAGWSKVLVPGALLWARIVAGDDLVKFSPIDEVAHYGGRHIAFVHGAKDAVLPASMSTDLRAGAVAAGAISPEVWIQPDATHTQAVYQDPAGYEERLVAFFTEALGAP